MLFDRECHEDTEVELVEKEVEVLVEVMAEVEEEEEAQQKDLEGVSLEN